MGTRKSKIDQHFHRVIRIGDIWKCALPDCRFFMYSRQAVKVLLGRFIICWSCGNKFPMNEDSFNQEQPICEVCSNPGIEEIADNFTLTSK